MEGHGAKRSPYAEKFRIMLRLIPHPDGGNWTGTKMERATGGKVSTSYYSSLRDDHIEVPRADKIGAIADAMGFQPGFWFKDLSWWRALEERWEEQGGGLLLGDPATAGEERPGGPAERLRELVNRLFETRVDAKTGEGFTNARVAQESGGVLTEGDVEALREGRLGDPTWAQVLALGQAFGVDPTFWAGHDAPSWRPPPAVMEAAWGAESYRIFQNSLRLSGRDRSMLGVIAEHLRREQEKREE